jgi:hypothetical protein
MDRFSKDGRLIIPLLQRQGNTKSIREEMVRYVLTEAYCPNGCSIIAPEHLIHDVPGLRIRFKRPGMAGEFIISAIEGDFDKVMLAGTLEKGVKDELYCPHCDAMFKKLVNCNCRDGADMVVIGLTPKLDFNNAVSFCNVTGCTNGTFIKSGDVILRMRLQGTV